MLCFGLISDRSQNLPCSGKYVVIFIGPQPVDVKWAFVLGTIGVKYLSLEAD